MVKLKSVYYINIENARKVATIIFDTSNNSISVLPEGEKRFIEEWLKVSVINKVLPDHREKLTRIKFSQNPEWFFRHIHILLASTYHWFSKPEEIDSEEKITS